VNSSLEAGPDGRRRCAWSLGAPDYVAYHDDEWGRPVTGDDALYERLCLEGFQSGLSWLTILRKRENFRAAFAGFRIEKVARFGACDMARLMSDAGIVRNRMKVEAAIENARAAARMDGSLAELVWSYREPRARAPRSFADIPALTPASTALSKELKKRGFRFVGPTTVYATLQACGVVNDHLAGCWVRGEVSRDVRSAVSSR
jgi:DNA-3-methyladenine glycosylase I